MADVGVDLSTLLARLQFDDNSVLRARDQFGFDIQHALTQKQSRYNLCVLVCCGLSHEQPAPGFKAIRKIITPEHAVENSPAWVAVGQALDRWQRTRKETEHHG